MGVPGLYGWLMRYFGLNPVPIGTKEARVKGETKTIPTTKQFVTCENLYLDMNSIVHPCCHSDEGEIPVRISENEMFARILAELDRIIVMCKPQQVLYLALDGVAPRAKINQMRTRRYRSIADSLDRKNFERLFRAEREAVGFYTPPGDTDQDSWDHNVITPGTEFMEELNNVLTRYVRERLSSHPAWKPLTVIWSSSNVPGEGEHKLIEFIRAQKDSSNGKEKNDNYTTSDNKAAKTHSTGVKHFKHCFVGDDGDLVLLGLATQESGIGIVRNDERRANLIFRLNDDPKRLRFLDVLRANAQYSIIEIDALKAALVQKIQEMDVSEFDTKRVAQDFVLLSFFCGNDFLPHLPIYDIREGAMEVFLNVYVNSLLRQNQYLLDDNQNINIHGFKMLIKGLANVEAADAFKKRDAVRSLPRELRHCLDFLNQSCKRSTKCTMIHGKKVPIMIRRSTLRNLVIMYALRDTNWLETIDPIELPNAPESLEMSISENQILTLSGLEIQDVRTVQEFALRINLSVVHQDKEKGIIVLRHPNPPKKKNEENALESHLLNARTIAAQDYYADLTRQLGSLEASSLPANYYDILAPYGVTSEPPSKEVWNDFKADYYGDKVPTLQVDTLCEDYIRTIQWNLDYYCKGLPSWNWSFRYNYAPFPSDLAKYLDNRGSTEYFTEHRWKISEPASPIEQLVTIMPRQSAHALPKPARPIIDEVAPPSHKITLDPNLKVLKWQWLTIMPMPDAEYIRKRVQQVRNEMTERELHRDTPTEAHIFTRTDVELGKRMNQFASANKFMPISALKVENRRIQGLVKLVGGVLKKNVLQAIYQLPK